VSAEASTHSIKNLSIISLKMGDNFVPHFAVDGRPARIIQAWRGNGNAHGYTIFLVAMPGGESQTDWNVVSIDEPHGPARDEILDSPYNGEQYLHSIRFAHGSLDGKPETLLLSARLNIKRSYGERASVTYDVYKLVHDDESFGTWDRFVLVERSQSAKRYCNAELAISRRFAIPLGDYGGPNKKDGCP
jgi:hypothetical protein